MNLNEYIWSMFDIARENDEDIGVGRDMFIANLEQKKAAYGGAVLDYEALGEAWDKLTMEEKDRQKAAYNHIVGVAKAGGYYKELTTARKAGDRDAFERIVAAALEELEKPAEGETETEK